MKYQVLLYYYYTDIEDPEAFSEEHLDLCKGMNLKGRILMPRNTYEYDVGHFPEWARKTAEILEGKRILTYCTGGIRCEKFLRLAEAGRIRRCRSTPWRHRNIR